MNNILDRRWVGLSVETTVLIRLVSVIW